MPPYVYALIVHGVIGFLDVAINHEWLAKLPSRPECVSEERLHSAREFLFAALFASLAETVGSRSLGVLLTGMGEDGARGLLALREAGGYAITEDETTAVVYGMPGAAARMGASSVALPLDLIAPRLLRAVKGDE